MPIPRLGRFARRVLMLLALSASGTAPLAAQASPYVPLDDASLPLLEYLIERGDVEDPSPMIRPFRRSDAVRVLGAADTVGSASAALIGALLEYFGRGQGEQTWAAEIRAGGQAYTAARRDMLHPAGDDGIAPYADLSLRAVFGNIVAATRPAVENRVTDDPDWPGAAGGTWNVGTDPSRGAESFVWPSVDSASGPPAPWTTPARTAPSAPSERATSSVCSGRETPMSCRVAPAGFVNGPSRLNAVRTPSSRRVGPACFIDGCQTGA
jgi:hypothetical protein